jgi:predicted permease
MPDPSTSSGSPRAQSRGDWKPEIRARIAALERAADYDDIVEELAQHLEDRYDELVGEGRSEADASRLALEELARDGVLERALRRVEREPIPPQPAIGRPTSGGWWRGLSSDVRDGLRALGAAPGLTLVAVVTLAVGIGANAAIFSVVNAAMLRPLPFADPNRLVSFWGSAPAMGLPVVAYPEGLYDYVRKRNQSFEGVAAYSNPSVTLTGRGEPERLKGAVVTVNFFDVLGRHPQLGRGFVAEEEAQGRNRVAVLGHGLWQRRFGGDARIVGQAISLDGTPLTVVGVMSEGFDFPAHAELWLPLTIDPQSLDCWCFATVGRLRAGGTADSAGREMARLNDDFWRDREGKPRTNPGDPPKSLIIAKPMSRALVGDDQLPLLVLVGAVAMVLLIACANLANLLLVRANARRRELAVRCCLGASPGRIVRQLLVESLLLAAAGAALGLAVAFWGARVLGRRAMDRLPHVQDVPLDPAVLFFTLGITLATVLVFGVAPALRGGRVDLQEAVKDGARTTRAASSRRLAHAFVIAQVALSLVLLVGAGLLLRSLANLLAIDPGFRAENVLVGRVTLPWPEYRDESRTRAFYQELEARVGGLPGVQRVGLSSSAPFSSGNNQQIFSIRGREPQAGQPKLVASVRGVSTGYFQAAGTALLRGRAFETTDTERTDLVAIVDETLARRFWTDGNALGHQVRLGDDGPWRTIVGVAASVRHGDLAAEIDRYVYVPTVQMPSVEMDILVRGAGDPSGLTAGIRRALATLDAAVPLYDVHTIEEVVERSLGPRRLTNALLAAFGLAALVLASLGIYGVMAYSVSLRVNEFGVRLALGATRRDVLALVLRQGVRLVALGVAFGLAAAFGLTRYLEVLLFRVQPVEPLVFGAVVVILALVALGACLVPARRATATNPLETLRAS